MAPPFFASPLDGVSFTFRKLYPRNTRSGKCEKEKNLAAAPGRPDSGTRYRLGYPYPLATSLG
jgi:hypothetical protein